jgi:hypothetical protein
MSSTVGNKKFEFNYLLNNVYIAKVDCFRDIGVYVSSNFKSSEHCMKVCQQAYRSMYSLLNCFVSRDKYLMLLLYKTYIRPILEYCTVDWNPYLRKDILSIEKVQNRFTKKIIGMRDLSSVDRNAALNLNSLELRRVQFDLIFMYKLVHGYLDIDCSDLIFASNTNFTRGSNVLKLFLPSASCNAKKYCFVNRTVPIWNSLSNDVVLSNCVVDFKRKINEPSIIEFITALMSGNRT